MSANRYGYLSEDSRLRDLPHMRQHRLQRLLFARGAEKHPLQLFPLKPAARWGTAEVPQVLVP